MKSSQQPPMGTIIGTFGSQHRTPINFIFRPNPQRRHMQTQKFDHNARLRKGKEFIAKEKTLPWMPRRLKIKLKSKMFL